jgi:lipopolysaccharide transport system permease protein
MTYLSAIWRCRYFWLSLVKMDLRARYQRSVVGIGWSLLHPIAMTAILCAAFHELMGQSIADFAPRVLAGLACWNYIVTTTLQGCQCFFQGEKYIRQFPAPLAIYPLRTALGGAFHFLVALSVVVLVMWIFNGIVSPIALLHLLPAILLTCILCWSLAVLAGVATVFFQDMAHLAEVGLQMMFYATPIIYPDSVLQGKSIGWVLNYNPVTSFLQLIREPILHGHAPSVNALATASLTVLLLTICAVLTLRSVQKRLIFYL